MNISKLKQAEKQFLELYPGGFLHPTMIEMGKKHKMEKMVDFAQTAFYKENFKNPEEITENMVKMVSRSSMVSVFEKPKFRDFVRAMDPVAKEELASALECLLYENEETGFTKLVSILQTGNIAKWPVVTVFGVYFKPTQDVLIKPTTVKRVIEYYELENIKYNSKPTYEFYKKYRDIINKMKVKVDDSFSTSNAAFSGFLMLNS
jgi:hypothetical protein